jgi:uncharacterized protein YjbJ (UPF0337 family)
MDASHKRCSEETTMDSDSIKGNLKQGVGKAKEEWGDLTNDESTQAEGQAEQGEGKVQEGWGDTKQGVRDAMDDGDNA